MTESTGIPAASLAELVLAAQGAELGDASAQRIATILTRTKGALENLSDQPRFDGEPADLVAVHRRVAPATGEAS